MTKSLKDKLKQAQSQTKFKTNTSNRKMWYSGTEAEAVAFMKELEIACKEDKEDNG